MGNEPIYLRFTHAACHAIIPFGQKRIFVGFNCILFAVLIHCIHICICIYIRCILKYIFYHNHAHQPPVWQSIELCFSCTSIQYLLGPYNIYEYDQRACIIFHLIAWCIIIYNPFALSLNNTTKIDISFPDHGKCR